MATKLEKKINDVVRPYCKCDWCILKEILISKHTDLRFLTQLKCIEHLKWEESQTQKRDIGWKEANMMWIDLGFAEAFAEFYDEDAEPEDIYKRILTRLNQETD